MNSDEKYLFRCTELAIQGLGNVQPNPMVGAVIVHNEKIIGEGFHQKFGEAHAEANAINSVKNKKLLSESTLYVNLEPCSHYGKTPPCVDLIVKHKIPKIVIGCKDSNPFVSGKGIEFLKKNGCNVKVGILKNNSRDLNKRFFVFHEEKRPYIILKWAQTMDGFIGKKNHRTQITNHKSQILLHKWRSEEQAIFVGTNTAMVDNPKLNVREWNGKNPTRIVIDKKLRLPKKFEFFSQLQPTFIFTEKENKFKKNLEFIAIDFSKKIIPQILLELYIRKIQSIIVEGGTQLLNSFIENGLWDEARIFTANKFWGSGIKSPLIKGEIVSTAKFENDILTVLKNSP